VAVISNGTAILGLGDRGALAGQPVKGVLFKTFADIDIFDIEVNSHDAKGMLDIPVFHDDQHGTAIISSAALANALEIVGKKHEEICIVISGATRVIKDRVSEKCAWIESMQSQDRTPRRSPSRGWEQMWLQMETCLILPTEAFAFRKPPASTVIRWG